MLKDESSGNMHMGTGTDAVCYVRGLKAFFHLLPRKCDSDVLNNILDI